MKQVVLSGVAALFVTAGLAFADSPLGADQSVFSSQTIEAVVAAQKDAASTNDATSPYGDFDRASLQSVLDQERLPTTGGVQ